MKRVNNQKGSFLKVLLYSICFCFLAIITLFVGCVVFIGGAINEVVEEAAEKENKALTTEVSNLSWDKINDVYGLHSKSTDLQKDALWDEYCKGKKVKWTGKVSSLSETFGTLTLQVKMNPETFTSDLIISLQEEERLKAVQLKEGDSVTFTGVLDRWGTIMPISLNYGQIVE